jgi:hypothetical protein
MPAFARNEGDPQHDACSGIEAQFLPDMTEKGLKRFTPFELLWYLEYKWTAEQLKKFLPGTWW